MVLLKQTQGMAAEEAPARLFLPLDFGQGCYLLYTDPVLNTPLRDDYCNEVEYLPSLNWTNSQGLI